MTVEFTLPWPNRTLSPNTARVHWAARARATKAARYAAWAITTRAMQSRPAMTAQRVKVHMAFVPPDRRRRDMDNLIASEKSSLDGIADALGIDDSRFIVSHELLATTGGEVRVTLEAAP